MEAAHLVGLTNRHFDGLSFDVDHLRLIASVVYQTVHHRQCDVSEVYFVRMRISKLGIGTAHWTQSKRTGYKKMLGRQIC